MTVFAMAVRWIPPDLSISLGAYAASVAGLALGLLGAVGLARGHPRR